MKGQAVRGREMAKLDYVSEGYRVYRNSHRGDHTPGNIRQREAGVVGFVRRPVGSSRRERVRVTPRAIAITAIGSYGTNTYKRIILGVSTGGITAAAILIIDAVTHGR